MDLKLWEGQLFYGSLKAKRGRRYYRVVFVSPEKHVVFIREVKSEVPKSSSSAVQYAIGEILNRIRIGALQEIDEIIRPREMGCVNPDSKVEKKSRDCALYRAELLGNLITSTGRADFYESKARRAEIMRGQAKKVGVTVSRLWLLITIFENFGCNMLALRPFRSTAKRKRGAAAGKKRGVKNVFEREDENSEFAGYGVSSWARHKIAWAVYHFVIRMGTTYETARILMHRLLWFQKNGSKVNDSRIQYAVSQRKMVSPSEFSYFARQLLKDPDNLRKLVGNRAWRDTYAPGRGAAGDIALGPGDVITMDCTTAKFKIVDTPRRFPIGRPTLAAVVDQATTTVLGIDVSIFGESSKLYRSALFHACTSKDDLMKFLGLPEGYFDYRANPNDIFIDHGPGNSDKFRTPLVVEDGPQMGVLIAPIACGRAKGVVEGLINIISRRLSKLPGGFLRDRTERAKDQRRDADKVANITRHEFLKYAYEAAKEHNDGLDFRAYSIDMRVDNVHPSRGEIFNDAMLKRRGGEKLALNEVDLYLGLLERLRPQKMKKEGVNRLGATFTSIDYQKSYEVAIANALGREEKLPDVVILKDPVDPATLFWQRGPQDYVRLECSPTDRARWERLHAEEVEFDLAVADQKVRIRETRRATFNAPLPGFIVDNLVRARRAVHSRSPDASAQARAEEREREHLEALRQSRARTAGVGDGMADAPASARPMPGLNSENRHEREAADEKIAVARQRRSQRLQDGMARFLRRKS